MKYNPLNKTETHFPKFIQLKRLREIKNIRARVHEKIKSQPMKAERKETFEN